MEHNPFQQITQSHVFQFGNRLQHLQQPLFHPDAGLNPFHLSVPFVSVMCTNVPRYTVGKRKSRSLTAWRWRFMDGFNLTAQQRPHTGEFEARKTGYAPVGMTHSLQRSVAPKAMDESLRPQQLSSRPERNLAHEGTVFPVLVQTATLPKPERLIPCEILCPGRLRYHLALKSSEEKKEIKRMSYVPNAKRYDGAQFRRCGRSGIVLPPVSLGLWQNFGGVDVFETGRAVVRRAFDRGVTHFDLANNYGPPYGSAEENFGEILRKDFRDHRNELLISSKAGWDMWPGPYGLGGSRKYLLASLDESLQPHGPGVCRHFLLPPADHGRAAGRNHGSAGAGSAPGQGFVCGHLVLQSGADARGGKDFAERRSAAADSSAVVLDAEPLGGEGIARARWRSWA